MCQQSHKCHVVMTSQYVRVALLSTRYPRYITEQIPVPPVLWSSYNGTRGTGIELISNLLTCRVPVSRPYRTNTRTPGIAVEGIPVPGVPVSTSYRVYRSFEYRYPVRTEPFRNVWQNIATVPNTPASFGRVSTDEIPPVKFGTYPTENNLCFLSVSTISAFRNENASKLLIIEPFKYKSFKQQASGTC